MYYFRKPCLFVALVLLASACKKEQSELEKLPDATQNGSGGAGFLLDGQAWLPEASKLFGSGPAVSATWRRTVAGRTLRVGFSRDSDDTSAGVFIPDIQRAGTYHLNQTANIILGERNPAYGGLMMFKPVPDRIFLTGSDAIGTVTVTRFDTVAHIVSGTFDMTVKEEVGPETHRLTQGRFDLRF
ncbi:hypothetical protein [Hymenobacter canadensis]|uniref:DUF4251 domain-containing protein n=1 Tax=Hymenobacter canadensis TaxID=2999067 RepID=A0ABY7LRJ3_9BACT|nr:hypothetical protein [Hymenobacter canadensis]WBA41830.1 hypothetical protein O3303_18725 [Hymenobacter canadensis]